MVFFGILWNIEILKDYFTKIKNILDLLSILFKWIKSNLLTLKWFLFLFFNELLHLIFVHTPFGKIKVTL